MHNHSAPSERRREIPSGDQTIDHQRRVFGRIPALTTKASQQASASLQFANAQVMALTTKASQQASASLQFANAQVTALTAEMEARRKAASR